VDRGALRRQSLIPFNDLKPLHGLLAEELEAAALRVLGSGWYILGPELEEWGQAMR
jgi:dTDP-3-amino-3,4,6-trideoxy-alpha-D-glucose transaminase